MNTTAVLQHTIDTFSNVLREKRGPEYAVGYLSSMLEGFVREYLTEEQRQELLEDITARLNVAVKG